MNFFTSPQDLGEWVKSQKPDEAAKKIIGIVGRNKEQDIVQTCRAMDADKNASQVLFDILKAYNITREGKMTNKMIKEAQIIGKDAPLYQQMELRVCPKLPYSVGKGLISTYNCRNGCEDNFTFDDDPTRSYCAEALWRRHVMDKFSREFKDKDGKWVGGYINERFQTFKDDGGNQMQLAHGERTRLPRPHQYSTERRLEEARGEKVADFLTASDHKMVKLAKVEEIKSNDYAMFNDVVEMKEAGISDEDIITKISDHYNEPITTVAAVHKKALGMFQRHAGKVYAFDNSKVVKTAQSQLPEKVTLQTTRDVNCVNQNKESILLEAETPVVKVALNTFHVVDGIYAGETVSLANPAEEMDSLTILDESGNNIQDTANEVMLNDSSPSIGAEQPAQPEEEFPVTQI